ncbi:hypothetical protein BDW59DRAFT_96629 [Aspergillus cavernicola]|uniref:DNA-binding protein n=1 Tax=Aspergillus cavernicola TaxID=176166 RepID=A0ABR4I760_9EURO
MPRPRPRMTWWMRLRRFIRYYESPLQIRGTLIRLGHRNKHPFLALLRLFLPLPTWHFPTPEPIPSVFMFNNIPLLETRMAAADLNNMRSVPLWRARDTPIRSLYRIYEAMAARNFYAVGPEVEYFWYQSRSSWAVHLIPDPHDCDPIRNALLASIAEQLADGFNWRLSLGMRRVKSKHIYRKTMDEELPPYTPEVAPAWTQNVPAIDPEQLTDLPNDAVDSFGKLVLESDATGIENRFWKRNIVTYSGHFYTI